MVDSAQRRLPGAPNNSNWNFSIGLGATVTGDGNTVHTLGQGVAGQTFIGEATFSGTGTTEFQSNVTISAPNNTSLTFGRSVTTDATTTWTSNNANQQGNVIVTGSWTNNGTLNRTQTNNNGGLQLNGTGSFTNSATGILNVTGGNDFVVSGGGTFDNSGTINVDGGELNVNAVTFNALANSSVNLSNNGSFIGNTTFDNADLSGSGTVTGNVTVANGGSISPGNSPGTLNVTGDLTVDASTVSMELGGLTAGTEYDVLNVSGTLAFQNGASVALQFFGTYDLTTAAPGDRFDIITTGTALSGLTPGSFDFSAVGGTGFWSTDITGTSASITFVPEPSSLAFLGLGVVGFAFRRRRS